jgi:hypothetical protein
MMQNLTAIVVLWVRQCVVLNYSKFLFSFYLTNRLIFFKTVFLGGFFMVFLKLPYLGVFSWFFLVAGARFFWRFLRKSRTFPFK